MNEADMVISQKSGSPSAPEVRQTANGSPSLPPLGADLVAHAAWWDMADDRPTEHVAD